MRDFSGHLFFLLSLVGPVSSTSAFLCVKTTCPHYASPWHQQDATSVPRTTRRRHRRDPIRNGEAQTSAKGSLYAYQLTSALESLAEEKGIPADYWLPKDLTSSPQQPPPPPPPTKSNNEGASFVAQESVPLYPLPAVYLPTGNSITYTLQNIEPRNIQMAQDLAQLPAEQRQFCATLRTVDTGRLACVGTLLRIVEMQRVEQQQGQVQKIVLTCVADDQTVEIVDLKNPDAAEIEHCLRRPREYLRANIRRRVAVETTTDYAVEATTTSRATELASNIARDFNHVRDYLLQGHGTQDLPVFARQNLTHALPALTASQLLSTESFWKAAYQWQTYAHTLSEGYQQRLASDRNELLIGGALKQGGPLNLPVHLTDLWPKDREQVVELEKRLQGEWVATGLEPILDFQYLLGAKTQLERLERLFNMVTREKERLALMTLSPPPARQVVETTRENMSRKGAWFDDDW